MATQGELLSVLVALQFVVAAAVVFVVAPLEVTAPLIPLFLVFLFAHYKYRF